jgi:hypothetical protein
MRHLQRLQQKLHTLHKSCGDLIKNATSVAKVAYLPIFFADRVTNATNAAKVTHFARILWWFGEQQLFGKNSSMNLGERSLSCSKSPRQLGGGGTCLMNQTKTLHGFLSVL